MVLAGLHMFVAAHTDVEPSPVAGSGAVVEGLAPRRAELSPYVVRKDSIDLCKDSFLCVQFGFLNPVGPCVGVVVLRRVLIEVGDRGLDVRECCGVFASELVVGQSLLSVVVFGVVGPRSNISCGRCQHEAL